MKSSVIKACILACVVLFVGCSSGDSSRMVIVTNLGKIEVQLYANTPEHSANFAKLAKEGYFDGTLFHRVIPGFMIQGGDPDSKSAQPGAFLGGGGPGYTVAAEFVSENIHRRGALAAARMGDQVNPEKASSGSQFYIVHGKIYTESELDDLEMQVSVRNATEKIGQFVAEEEQAMLDAGETVVPDSVQIRARRRASEWLLQNPYKMRAEDRKLYTTIGGAPHLDGEYTVFGEVVKGFNIVDKIAASDTDDRDRPRADVIIKRIRVK